MKFLLKWRFKEDRSPEEVLNQETTPIDDVADTGSSIKLIRHWHEDGRGVAILDAEDAGVIHLRTLSWNTFLDLSLTRISEDDG